SYNSQNFDTHYKQITYLKSPHSPDLYKTHKTKSSTMPRIKRTIKKSKGSSSVVPPPNDHPLARYFASNEDLQFYEARLAGRKEIPP
ncbi:hypothetical protein HN873_004731, partial [Arachis hypogaea]